MFTSTAQWWAFLCAASALNVLAWLWAAGRWRGLAAQQPELWRARRWQLLLSAVYVLGCGWRSLHPVYDVPRLVLVDGWQSSVVLGRSVATLAELCFAAQWSLLLGEAARAAGSRSAAWVARGVLPMIVVAEVFSWHAVLTTSNLGHAFEESLWGLCAALQVAAVVHIAARCAPRQRPLLALWAAAALAYAAYMFGVNVPMYWQRWLADEAQGRGYLSLAQGWVDVSTRWVVSHHWEHWQSEVVWMSLYFSVAVWLSIALAHAPRLARAATAAPLEARRARVLSSR